MLDGKILDIFFTIFRIFFFFGWKFADEVQFWISWLGCLFCSLSMFFFHDEKSHLETRCLIRERGNGWKSKYQRVSTPNFPPTVENFLSIATIFLRWKKTRRQKLQQKRRTLIMNPNYYYGRSTLNNTNICRRCPVDKLWLSRE